MLFINIAIGDMTKKSAKTYSDVYKKEKVSEQINIKNMAKYAAAGSCCCNIDGCFYLYKNELVWIPN